jgi:hypothetical protein
MKKRKIRFFVSYARANAGLAARFLGQLREQFGASKTYAYALWRDVDILVGESWHDEIQQALAASDLGLALISPAFLGSQYIGEHELPAFTGDRPRPLIPVMLQAVDLERHDLKGLEQTQIFRLDSPRFREPKAYGDCNSGQRERFTRELFRRIELRLDKLTRHDRGPAEQRVLLEGNDWTAFMLDGYRVAFADYLEALAAATSGDDFARRIGAHSPLPDAETQIRDKLRSSRLAREDLNQARRLVGAQPLAFR